MSNSMNIHGVTKLVIKPGELGPMSHRAEPLATLALNITDDKGVRFEITLFAADEDNPVPVEISI